MKAQNRIFNEFLEIIQNKKFKVILLNDDVNTIEHVVYVLVMLLKKKPYDVLNIAKNIHEKGEECILEDSIYDLYNTIEILKNSKLNFKILK